MYFLCCVQFQVDVFCCFFRKRFFWKFWHVKALCLWCNDDCKLLDVVPVFWCLNEGVFGEKLLSAFWSVMAVSLYVFVNRNVKKLKLSHNFQKMCKFPNWLIAFCFQSTPKLGWSYTHFVLICCVSHKWLRYFSEGSFWLDEICSAKILFLRSRHDCHLCPTPMPDPPSPSCRDLETELRVREKTGCCRECYLNVLVVWQWNVTCLNLRVQGYWWTYSHALISLCYRSVQFFFVTVERTPCRVVCC